MRHELISDCRTNEVRPIGIEPFLHEQIDLPQVDQSDIDGDLLGVRALRFGLRDTGSIDIASGFETDNPGGSPHKADVLPPTLSAST